MVVRLCGTSESTDVRNNALQMLREAIASSTSSMTAVPKPLKFLRPHYGGMKDTFRALDAKVRARRGRAEQMGQRRQCKPDFGFTRPPLRVACTPPWAAADSKPSHGICAPQFATNRTRCTPSSPTCYLCWP